MVTGQPLHTHATIVLLGAALFVLLLLWQTGWAWAALPGWSWGAALLFGLIIAASLSLNRKTGAQPPLIVQVLRKGAGWGLTFLCYTVSVGVLKGSLSFPDLLILLPAAAVMTCAFGIYEVLRQRQTRA